MNKPRVTVFIPVKNGANFIANCIDNIVAQTFRQWILIIVDNCSEDNTASICAKYSADNRIIYIKHDFDIGAVNNFNYCLEHCSTEYYAIYSHDDYLSCTDALEASLVIMDRESEICAVYSHLLWVDEDAQLIKRHRFRRTHKVWSDDVAWSSILSCRNHFGVPILVRTKDRHQIRYDSELYHICDIDFSIRLGRQRYIYVLDKYCFSIRFHRSNNTMRSFSNIKFELLACADKNGIKLTKKDRIIMSLNNVSVRFQKQVFFFLMELKNWVRQLGMNKIDE